jgi:hypothetical protein
VLFTPASSISEEFFRQAGEPARNPTATPPPANPERFAAVVESTGLQVLGPPPFSAAAESEVQEIAAAHR